MKEFRRSFEDVKYYHECSIFEVNQVYFMILLLNQSLIDKYFECFNSSLKNHSREAIFEMKSQKNKEED